MAVFTKDLIDKLDLTGEFAPAQVIAIKKKQDNDQYENRVIWQITKEKNRREVVDVPCVPSLHGWVILANAKRYPINEMMNW